MPEVSAYATGQPCWADVTHTDVHAAARFYSALFGWHAERVPEPEARGYTLFLRDGKAVAAAAPAPPEGGAAGWTVYLATNDVDDTVLRVREEGAPVLMEPLDVLDAGRMALVADPAGATFALWEGRRRVGSALGREPGTLNWAEVHSTDVATVRRFYDEVFEYTSEPMAMAPGMEYVVFKVAGQPAAGLMPIDASTSEVSAWSVVFQVEDCDAAVERVRDLEGSVQREPTELEGIGRFAVVSDPWGASFQLIQ
jgi:predicted enzyme related to lactoylglutathione lyase